MYLMVWKLYLKKLLVAGMEKQKGVMYGGWAVANGEAFTYQSSIESCGGNINLANFIENVK